MQHDHEAGVAWAIGTPSVTQTLPETAIKRLEILKNYLLLDDEVGAAHASQALSAYAHRPDIAALQAAAQAGHFGEALIAIDGILRQYHAKPRYQAGLSAAQVKKLEHALSIYENEKNALERTLTAFHRTHIQVLGWYVLRLLQLKACLVKDDDKARSDAEVLVNWYQVEIAKHHPDTHRVFRNAYQTARQLCRYNQDTQLAFMALDHAYDVGDLNQVRHILSALKDGSFRPKLQAMDATTMVAVLSHEIKRIKEDIERIKSSSVYQRILNIKDVNAYCESVKLDLIDEIDRLEQQLGIDGDVY